MFEGAECISYGARVLNEGGYHAVPQLYFPGGALAGCSAGFLNVSKIKGTHNAMKTGMLAAEAIFEKYSQGKDLSKEVLENYQQKYEKSWVAEELYESRNFKSAFDYGLYPGLMHGGLTAHVTKGAEPWTLSHKHPDFEKTQPAELH